MAISTHRPDTLILVIFLIMDIYRYYRNATFAPNKANIENCMQIYYRNLYGRVVCHLFMMFFLFLGRREREFKLLHCGVSTLCVLGVCV